jgi:uncharacterized membrane protein YphA (DoxX/SURF4 family)
MTANRWLILLLRLALGGLFVTSSIAKFQHPELFTSALLKYGILPEGLARFYAAVLPWAELFIGCSLILGIFVILFSTLSIPLICSFIVANIYALFRPMGEACSCLGNLVNLNHPAALAIDVGMLLVAVLLVWQRQRGESIGLGHLISTDSLRLGKWQRRLLKSGTLAICVVAVIALVGIPTSVVDEEMNDALKQGKPVLLFLYEGEPSKSIEQFVVLSNIELYYGGRVHVIRYGYGADPSVDREFRGELPPALLIIAGKRSNGYDVRARYEGQLSESDLSSMLDSILQG